MHVSGKSPFFLSGLVCMLGSYLGLASLDSIDLSSVSALACWVLFQPIKLLRTRALPIQPSGGRMLSASLQHRVVAPAHMLNLIAGKEGVDFGVGFGHFYREVKVTVC